MKKGKNCYNFFFYLFPAGYEGGKGKKGREHWVGVCGCRVCM